MKRLTLTLGLVLLLSGCATRAATVEPSEMTDSAAPPIVLEAALVVLMERGYVIRHGDVDLGRLDAVLARWPGYRVEVAVEPLHDGSRVLVSASRGGRALPNAILDPFVLELRQHLGQRP
jgi:starvation-inducible outer membrane lipoprotein